MKRGTCATCKRDVPLRMNGRTQMHRPPEARGTQPQGPKTCPGSDKEPKRLLEQIEEIAMDT